MTVGQIVAIIAGGEAGAEGTSSLRMFLSGLLGTLEQHSSALVNRQGALAAEKPKPSGKRSKKASEGQSEQKKAAASQAPPSEEGSSGEVGPAARTPMIQFPKRMTDDGTRISSLSVEEQQR